MLSFKNIKHFSIILLGSLLVSFLVYSYFGPTIGQLFNFTWLYAGNYNDSSNKIVIVKIDNRTLDVLQSTDLRVLNFTKSKIAETIEKLEKYNVRAIGLDIVFANKSEDTNVLVRTLNKYSNIVLGAKIGFTDNEERILPLSDFSGTTWGSVDTVSNIDSNIMSRMRPALTLSGQIFEVLSVATYRKYLGNIHGQVGTFESGAYIFSPLKSLPLDEKNTMFIRFFNPPEKYPSISLIDILQPKSPEEDEKNKELLSGKIVLIGEYGTLIHDDHFSPVDTRGKMPGVEFHANVIDGLLQNKSLISQSSTSLWLTLVLFSAGLILLFFAIPTHIAIVVFIVFLFLLILVGRDMVSGYDEGIVINLFFYLVTLTITFIDTYIYKFLIVDRNKRYIEGAFGRYISPDVVKEISKNTKALQLGGANRRIAVYFSDIANFTTLSETLGTEKIFTLLGEYLSAMTEILIENRGTLDKYIGDAVMGFFGAPQTVERSAYHACLTALQQQEVIFDLNKKWQERGFPMVYFRVGIHIGEAMVGNIGSKDRFNYTAIGDTVNLASRLEGVNKEYGTLICVSEEIYADVHGDFCLRELDTIRVKGKKEGKKIYELIGKKEAEIDIEKYEKYEEGLRYYYDEKYEDALEIFSSNRKDFTSEILATRCKKILSSEIVVKDGIYEMKNK